MPISLVNVLNRWCFLNQSTFETSYSKDLILHAEREKAKKISLSGYKPRHRHKIIRKRLRIQNLRDPKIRVHLEQSQYSNCNRLYLSAPKIRSHDLSCETTETQQGSGEKANHACVKFSGGKMNYRTDEELVSSLGSAFIAINFIEL